MLKEARMLFSELGLTPTGRARLRWVIGDELPAEVRTIEAKPAWIPNPRDDE